MVSANFVRVALQLCNSRNLPVQGGCVQFYFQGNKLFSYTVYHSIWQYMEVHANYITVYGST